MKKITLFLRTILLAGILFLWLSTATVQGAAPVAVVLTAKGPLSPVFAQYIERGLRVAAEQHAEVVILQLDTPGGSVDIMNGIVQTIRTSVVPVVVYVQPRGAMAASAGTIITLAGHLSAMAPETTIGAASPVGGQGEDIGETMESKVKEILKASARAIAQDRAPAAIRLVEDMIDKAKAVYVDEALEVGLVDIKASDMKDLLSQLHGRTARTEKGAVTLNTQNVYILAVDNTLTEQILQLLVNPNIVFILMAVGIQAIIIELSSPGGWVTGFIGAVCLLLAIYGLGILPVNWFGFLLIIMAAVLFFMEFQTPTHGALPAAGAACFIAGSLVLFNTNTLPGFPTVSVPLVVGTGIFLGGTFFLLITYALKTQGQPIKVGKDALIGQKGVARSALAPAGQVQVAGELWSAELAEGQGHIQAGEPVEVVDVDGLRLIVRNAKK